MNGAAGGALRRCLRVLLHSNQIEGRLLGNGLWSFLIQGGGAAVLLLTEVILARMLGPGGFGGYAWAVSLLLALSTVAVLGLNNVILRWVPAYIAHEKWGLARGLIRYSVWRVLMVSLLLSLVVVVVSRSVTGFEHAELAALVALGLPFATLQLLLLSILRSLHRIKQALAPDMLFKPALLMVSVWLLWQLAPAYLDDRSAVLIYTGSTAAAFALSLVLYHMSRPAGLRDSPARSDGPQWRATALPLLGLSLLALLQSRIDVLIVGLLTDPAATGIYAAGVRLASLLVFPLLCLNTVAASMISGSHARDGSEPVQRIMDTINTAMVVLTVPLAFLLIALGPSLLSLFGPGFDAGYPALVILVAGQTVNALSGSVGMVMMMTGHQGAALRIVLVSAIVAISLHLVLIPRMGIVGAAMATAISTLLWNLFMLRYLKQRLGLVWSMMTPARLVRT